MPTNYSPGKNDLLSHSFYFYEYLKHNIMHMLIDQTGKQVAIISNNIIFSVENRKILGVTLGECVFGTDALAKGKIFKNIFYSSGGCILAVKQKWTDTPYRNNESSLQQAWEILIQIKDHVCPWIVPSEKWCQSGLHHILTDKKNSI